MWERIRHIVIKELRQTLREPRMRAILIGPPVLQMIIFGYAVNLDVERVRLAWMDPDQTTQSRELRERFTASPYFELVAFAGSGREAERLLDRGQAQAVVRVLPGFGAGVARGQQQEVQVLLDGANSNSAGIIASYANGVIAAHNRELLREQQMRKLVGRTREGPVRLTMPGVRAETRIWFNPELKSRNYFVPGVVVNIILLVTLMLTALSVVREKEIGTMEQIMVTPIRPIELMLGKTIPFALVGLFDMVLVTTVALALFQVPFRGSIAVLFLATVLFLLTTLGAGLFLSTVSSTQQQAMISSFFFFQPAFMLSGFTFPIRNMPEVVQWMTLLNPMRYFMDIVRGVFLKGVGIEVLWPQLLMLGLFGVLILWFSALRFRKRLD
jgi:ABC-2 type transport system permease protein